jgi:hypothetical protein
MGGLGAADAHAVHVNKSPIETVFTLNLRDSLLSYQEYLETLQKEKDALKVRVRTTLS